MKNKSILALTLVSVFFLLGSTIVSAQQMDDSERFEGPSTTTIPPGPGTETPAKPIVKLDNPIKANNVQSLLFAIVDLAIFLGSIVAVLMFVYVGFKFVMAQGNETEIKEAKAWFMYAVIGTTILISSKVIVEVVQNTLVSAGVVEESAFTLPK